ncbi:MAG TPA: DinB family protein, partial [Longimicrobium sp.]|nr:DinB family protein [Longimicrobium sp.]
MSDDALAGQLIDTWRIHDRINHYLLDAVPAEALSSVSASKGRTVGEQIAHVHNVRLMWLQQFRRGLLEPHQPHVVHVCDLLAHRPPLRRGNGGQRLRRHRVQEVV